MTEIINIILAFFSGTGYWGVFFLMAIESSFVPFPSEVVIPPAAYLAAQGQGSVYLVVLFGILGTLFGAAINYFLALKLGRTIVYRLVETRLAKMLLLSKDKIKKAEDYFLRYGNVSTFFGRLVPAVRQLISIPAGFSRMNLKNFFIYTGLGSGIWVAILAFLGYQFGSNEEALSNYYHYLKYGLVLILFLLLIFLITRYKKK